MPSNWKGLKFLIGAALYILEKPNPIRAELILIADLAVNVYKPKTYAFYL